MIINFSCAPHQIKQACRINVDFKNARNEEIKQFPLASIDTNSYVVSSEIQSGLDLGYGEGCHNLQIGKYCSIADKISFMINLNHDFKNVTTCAGDFLKSYPPPRKIRRKGQILIQNDVWIGHGATIMSGVTIHNGAVVAAEAVVAKDVPAYAIVAGNPAKIIKYRFEKEEIEKLLVISWWNWTEEKLRKNGRDFDLTIDKFIASHYPGAIAKANRIEYGYNKTKPIILFMPDFDEPYPVYPKVIKEYCGVYHNNTDQQLLIYINQDDNAERNRSTVSRLLRQDEHADIKVHIDKLSDEEPLFSIADKFITTRAIQTIVRTCYADRFGVSILSGVDLPVFSE